MRVNFTHKYETVTSRLRQGQVLVRGHKPRWLPNQWIEPFAGRFRFDKVWTKLCRVEKQADSKQGIFAPESDISNPYKINGS